MNKYIAEFVGTLVLVLVGLGTAIFDGGGVGHLGISLAFGLTLLAMIYTMGPISGCHINPAVTLGFVVSGRMSCGEAIGYWVAQFVGGIAGALILWGIVSGAPSYTRSGVGLGADGWGSKASMIGLGIGGAFATEVVLTFVFVLVVLVATSRVGSPGFAGLAIGLALTVVHLVGIPLTGTSVNPARSLGPAIIVGHQALSQVWLFIVAPLLGGAGAALIYRYLVPKEAAVRPTAVAEGDVERTTATP